jgi:hypothetical protein
MVVRNLLLLQVREGEKKSLNKTRRIFYFFIIYKIEMQINKNQHCIIFKLIKVF